MPIAVAVAVPGDVRDALGLYLAGHGWTALPVGPDAAEAVRVVTAAAPELVAVDFREAGDAAVDVLAALARAGAPAPHLFNVPERLRQAAREASPDAVEVTAESGLPRAPGVPGPPH